MADTNTDTFDLFINGTQVLNDTAFKSAVSDLAEIYFYPYTWKTGTVYYDNVKIK